MPRSNRDSAPGIFHVNAHSVWSNDLFLDPLDRVLFVTELARTIARFRWTCLLACLMTSHYHLLLDIPDESLPLGMHRLNFRYARSFHALHRLQGHAFGGRYSSTRIESDRHLLAAFRYVARNPVEAGICVEPEAWPWSSYGALVNGADSFTFVDPSRVLGCFDDNPARALDLLRTFVETR